MMHMALNSRLITDPQVPLDDRGTNEILSENDQARRDMAEKENNKRAMTNVVRQV